MAEGLASATATAILDCYCNATNITAPANIYIQLHTAAPGAAGTSNIAGNATRKDLTSSMAAASAGAITSNAAVSWTSGEVDTSEDYTHCTFWTASSAGTFLFSGTVTANAVTAGDTFTIASGDIDISLTIAS